MACAENNISTSPASAVVGDRIVELEVAIASVFEMDQLEQALPAVEFRKVSFSFDDEQVLDRLSFKVMKDEIILGSSGVGKSTILKLILGLLKPDDGQVLIDGEDITNYVESQLKHVRDKIGMVFQEGGLFDSLTVYDNVAYRKTTLRSG